MAKTTTQSDYDLEHPFELGAAYVEGDYVPLMDARMPITDLGFRHSDVVYDGIPFKSGRIFRFDDHMDRFFESMRKWRIPAPLERENMKDILVRLVQLSKLHDGVLWPTATRGVPPHPTTRGSTKLESRFYAWSSGVPKIATAEQLKSGLSIIVANTRRTPDFCVDSTAKNHHWGDLVQARFEAHDRGADNSVLLDIEGNVSEGPGFNVFVFKDGQLSTPGRHCLHGITRQTIIEIGEALQIPVRIGTVTLAELYAADEVFFTTSAGGVLPVTSIEGKPIGDGAVGTTCKRIFDEYWKWRVAPDLSVAVEYEENA